MPLQHHLTGRLWPCHVGAKATRPCPLLRAASLIPVLRPASGVLAALRAGGELQTVKQFGTTWPIPVTKMPTMAMTGRRWRGTGDALTGRVLLCPARQLKVCSLFPPAVRAAML